MDQPTQPQAPRPVLFAPLHEQRITQREVLFGVYNRLAAQIVLTSNAQDLAALSRELRETTREIRRLSASIEKKTAHDTFDRVLSAITRSQPCETKKKRR